MYRRLRTLHEHVTAMTAGTFPFVSRAFWACVIRNTSSKHVIGVNAQLLTQTSQGLLPTQQGNVRPALK